MFAILLLTFVGTLVLISRSVERETVKKNMNRDEFITEVASHAKPLEDSHGIKPSVTIAQAILESNWGESSLSQEENNYFGIKGKSGDQKYATREYEDGWKEIHASFRSYPSLEASVKDYADLIKGGTAWDSELYKGVQESSTYQEAARALYAAGYATDPTYPDKIIEIIEQYDLDRYDN